MAKSPTLRSHGDLLPHLPIHLRAWKLGHLGPYRGLFFGLFEVSSFLRVSISVRIGFFLWCSLGFLDLSMVFLGFEAFSFSKATGEGAGSRLRVLG